MKSRTSKKFGKRVACIGLTAMMVSTFIAGQAFAFGGKGGATANAEEYALGFENANGKIDLSAVKLSNLNDKVMENKQTATEMKNVTRTVIVRLDGSALPDDREATNAERREIERRQNQFLTDLKKEGISYSFKSRYYSIFNGVAIDVKLSELAKIKAIDGVKTVTVGSSYERPKAIEQFDGATTNFSSIYGTGIYDSSAFLESKADGSGMTVAILDTGLDYTHEAFAEENLDAGTRIAYTYDRVQELMNGTDFKASVRSGATVDDVFVSKKVPFAYDYADNDADVYPSYSQHGTHVAGIVAGKCDSYTDKDGIVAKDESGVQIPFRGVAPEAQLVICKVFTDNLESDSLGGAEAVDILDALEDCYNLNVDIVNMSLGTSNGFSSKSLGLTEEDEEGYLMNEVYTKLRNKGITMMIAASNEYSSGYGSAFGTNLATNPDSGTVGSPSTFLGSMSVASVNGQLASYMLANPKVNADGTLTGGDAVYYEESRNEDSDAFNFINDILGDPKKDANIKNKGKIKYVVVDGNGAAGDYTASVKRQLADKGDYDGVVALVRRGVTNFKDKIEVATDNGADGVIVYNNVSGMIRMSLGDMDDHVPSVSVSLEIGLKLRRAAGSSKTGVIYLDRSYLAGPFMNDYSSWGPSPTLQLKPDVTSHGGEILSTVSGGYDEMSGTSMACPNLAGFTALLKGYLKTDEIAKTLWQNEAHPECELTRLTNNILMSTATVVYDQNGLPYSPRKQGAGLATMKNVFSTKAYLYTKDTYKYGIAADAPYSEKYDFDDPEYMCEDGRPKAELGDDPQKTGKYEITFYVKNFDTAAKTFTTNSIVMTETLGEDGMSVAEKATVFGDDATWEIDGKPVAEGGSFQVPANGTSKVKVTIQLSESEKKYLNETFKNGMYVEGFLQLKSNDGAQCDLNFPFLAFYGDWGAAQMLDLDCFEIADDAKDTSKKDEERRQPSVWATQPYGLYWNEKYVIPLGSFIYKQDEAKEHTADYAYMDRDYISVSRFNEFYGEGSTENYLTATGLKALYAGLLRNAEVVTYRLTNADTGEQVLSKEVYRVGKAVAAGGSSIPANVQLDLRSYELGLSSNGKYRMDFDFYANYDDYASGKTTDDTFEFSFYVDYEAPILVDSRLRFQDRKDENNKDIQKVYLDLDVFDNHYPQAVLLCYRSDDSETGGIKLATEYITPVLNPLKNTTNTISIDITDLYEAYRGKLYVELDDYALNNNVYMIDLNYTRTESVCPSDFNVTLNGEPVTEITVPLNTSVKLGIDNLGGANISNFGWTLHSTYASVKNGEVFGKAVGRATLTVSGGRNAEGKTAIKTVTVNVVDSQAILGRPSIQFGAILNADEAIVSAKGMVRVAPGQRFKLDVIADPWYYPVESLRLSWKSSDPSLATVDRNGNVEVLYEGDKVKNVTITATAEGLDRVSASVILSIRDPYTISGGVLSKYQGLGGELKDGVIIGGETLNGVRVLEIPNDRSITQIGSEAFKDNKNVEVVVIPKAVTTISDRAFIGCTNLKKICFVTEKTKDPEIPSASSLFMIERDAFSGCTSLQTVDLSNCKVITLDLNVFSGCTALKEVISMTNIGTMGSMTFAGCTSLKSVDISKLHVAGYGVFAGCTALTEVVTGKETAFGESMFNGCASLKNIEINCSYIPDGVFYGCSSLNTVTLNADVTSIGASAFENCFALTNFDLNGHNVGRIGDRAFYMCSVMNNLYGQAGFMPELGYNVFGEVTAIDGAKKKNGVLYSAPKHINSAAELAQVLDGVTEIGAYAFSGTTLAGAVDTIDLTGITKLGEGAFYGLYGLKNVTLPALSEIGFATFRGTSLGVVEIPASVKKIGRHAFSGNASLRELTFAEGSQLTEIGANAFDGCAIETLTLPDGVKTIGDEAFACNRQLTAANISSVTDMGMGAFAFCPKLATVTFGANATDAGTYTFFGGKEKDGGYPYAKDYSLEDYRKDENGNVVPVLRESDSALVSVTLSDNITRLDEGVFALCSALQTVNLNKVTDIYGEIVHKEAYSLEGYVYGKGTTVVGNAFYGCVKLEAVTGLEKVKNIGPNAFAHCYALTAVNLAEAESVTYRAFFACEKLTEVAFGSALDGIGDEAFAETALERVIIPANCTFVGVSAFSGGKGVISFSVENGSKHFFADEVGVLYRYVNAEKTAYQLVAYPVRAVAPQMTYTVAEGTVTISDYAFYLVPSKSVNKVIFPHTLKSIGNGAFFMSEISTYRFESITAPTLLEGIAPRLVTRGTASGNSFFYNNFVGYLANFVSRYPGDTGNNAKPEARSRLTIEYPANGTGYDNFVYNGFFGSKKDIGELCEVNTYEFISIIESLADPAAVGGMTDRDAVVALHAQVKQAHILYNTFSGSKAQLAFAGEDNVKKMFELEEALKPLKKKFNIPVKVTSVKVDESSAHKTEYREGENFSINGLKLLITYDDNSQDVIDASGAFKPEARFERALRKSDVAVTLEGVGEYQGKIVSVPITVTEGKAGDGKGLPAVAIALIVVGVVAVLAAGAVVTLLILSKKGVVSFKGRKKTEAVEAESTATDETQTEEPEKTEEPATDGAEAVEKTDGVNNEDNHNDGEEKSDD